MNEDFQLSAKRHTPEINNIEDESLLKTIRPRVPALEGCRSIDNFTYLKKINEGSYGIVFKAQDNQTGEIVAIKKIKLEKEKEGFPITSLREINSMIFFEHPNIVKIKEVAYGSSLEKIFVVMEYVDNELKSLLENRKFILQHGEVKCLMKQLLKAVAYIHSKWIIHRDLKTSNLLVDKKGVLKVCDFGLARKFADPLRLYTSMVVTLWYRAPELLLGGGVYTPAIDIWSIGCIFAELLLREPLFMGKNEQDQVDRIFLLLGLPPDSVSVKWAKYRKMLSSTILNSSKVVAAKSLKRLRERFPKAGLPGEMYLTDCGVDLLNRLLSLDPQKRITATEALDHPWFKEDPLPQPLQHFQISENEFEINKQKRKKSLDEEQIKQREEIHEGKQRFDDIHNREYQIAPS